MKFVVKKTKARPKRKRKWNRTVGILLFTTVMGTLIIISVLQSKLPPPIPKKPANEYFSFTGGIAFGESQDPQNTSILISGVSFNVTAVGGNATHVIMRPLQGMVREENFPYFDKILQGESKVLAEGLPGGQDILGFPSNVPSTKEEGKGYPLRFEIFCDEAYGEVTIYATKFYPSSGS